MLRSGYVTNGGGRVIASSASSAQTITSHKMADESTNKVAMLWDQALSTLVVASCHHQVQARQIRCSPCNKTNSHNLNRYLVPLLTT
jgi:hypothetical protein